MSTADTPKARVEAACVRWGTGEVVARCVASLDGTAEPNQELLEVLAGRATSWYLEDPGRDDSPWLRVWSLRGLLWAYEPQAAAAVRRALGDPAWRVREMAAKVVARHLVDEALEEVAALADDAVPRVRGAAHRALVRLSAAVAPGGG